MATRKTAAAAAEETKEAVVEEKKPLVPTEVDIHQFIPVINGFSGMLVYQSKRTGEKFLWENFGDEQEMELQELRNAKSSAKDFFQNNWFLFKDEDDWVIDWLGMRAYYRDALKLEEFDTIFEKTPAAIKKAVAKLSDGQKRSLAYRARVAVADGIIDSNKVIGALEEALGTQLVNR